MGYKTVHRNQRIVGWSVGGRAVGRLVGRLVRSMILRRELLPQFLTNYHQIWHSCLPWGVDVQDTFFNSGRKCIAMVMAYYGQKLREILRRKLLPQFLTNSHEIWHIMFALGRR